MTVSYKKLWKLLIDKDMKKKDLCAKAGISPASVTKMGTKRTCYHGNTGKNLCHIGLWYWRHYGNRTRRNRLRLLEVGFF